MQGISPAPDASPASDAAPSDAAASDAQRDTDPRSAVDGGPMLDTAKVDAQVLALDLGAANPCGSAPEPLAAKIKVREVAIYQSVKIPLFKDGAWLTSRNAPVVQGKKSLVRVFVQPESGFTPRRLRGVIALYEADKVTVLTSELEVTSASSDEARDSTFDFALDGAAIGPDTRLSVELLETSCVRANASGARVPAQGAEALLAEDTGELHVVLVPISYQGRTPDVSTAQLDQVRRALRAHYPVADVEVSARTPINWSNPVLASGIGWSDLLTQIGRQRQLDAPAANVYYFGWVLPSASFKDYCRGGCVLGLAPQTFWVSHSNQIGLGVGFVDENAYVTIVHELGHAHGLPHAPCAPKGTTIEGADTKFPYSGATIGVWGWDERSAKLLSPSSYTDIMSYCEPTWVSDYNYRKLSVRSKAVNDAAYVFSATKQARRSFRGVVLYADGSARWSGLTTDEQPGELSEARALDADGDLVVTLGVVRVPLSNAAETFLYIPEPDPDWTAIDLGDRTLDLSEIAPPL